MAIEHWLAYALVVFALVAVPGPTIVSVVAQTLAHGPRAVWPLTGAVAAGDAVAVSLALAGIGSLLALAPEAFAGLRLVGGALLLWLAVGLWRRAPGVDADVAAPDELRAGVRSTFFVTAFNPKGWVFFVAFLPAFVQADRPAGPQLGLLGVTFVILGAFNAALYALFAARVRHWLADTDRWRWVQRGSALLIAMAGLWVILA